MYSPFSSSHCGTWPVHTGAGSVLETAAAFKGDFMRRRFKIPLPPCLSSRGDRSRAPPFAHKPIEITANRKEARLGTRPGFFSLEWPSIDPFPISSPSPLSFLSTVFPCRIELDSYRCWVPLWAELDNHDTCLVREGLREDRSYVKRTLLTNFHRTRAAIFF